MAGERMNGDGPFLAAEHHAHGEHGRGLEGEGGPVVHVHVPEALGDHAHALLESKKSHSRFWVLGVRAGSRRSLRDA